MISTTISAVFQVLLFTAIPFLVYVFRNKSARGFIGSIGLKRSTSRANLLALLVMVLLVAPLLILVLTNDEFRAIMTDPDSVTGKIREMGVGVEAVVTILITAVVKTSLAEEIFFRGFLAKRLIAVTNYQVGNVLQAVIFGIVHTLLFMSITANVWFLATIFVFPAAGAYFKTYLNEKLANGSILPGWIAHGTANLVSYGFILIAT